MKGLRNVFYAQGIYLVLLGLMFSFAPSVAEAIFQTSLKDPIITPLFGQVILVLAIASFIAATDAEKYIKLVWAFLFDQVGHILVFAFLLIKGTAGFMTVGPPMIIAVAFLVLLVVYYRKAIS